MNVNPTWLRAAIVAAWMVAVPGGHGQEARPASLQAESDNNRLVLVGKNLTWEQVRGFGLIVEHTTDMTGPVRAALADTSARVELIDDGFLLEADGPEGEVTMTLDIGAVLPSPILSVRTVKTVALVDMASILILKDCW
jgi:hypothetical protein